MAPQLMLGRESRDESAAFLCWCSLGSVPALPGSAIPLEMSLSETSLLPAAPRKCPAQNFQLLPFPKHSEPLGQAQMSLLCPNCRIDPKISPARSRGLHPTPHILQELLHTHETRMQAAIKAARKLQFYCVKDHSQI